MAARGFVHSAVAFQRSSGVSGERAIGRFVPCARAKRFTCRLLPYTEVSHTRGPVRQRGMASTPVAVSNQTVPSARSSAKTKYEEAVITLNSLQSNAEAIRKSIQNRSESRKHNIPNMINYLQRVGLSVDDIDSLCVIHVTGTKGKGSTCAFAESILRQYGYKTGIFSSPHLIEARERIRIDGRPVDRDLFSTCFWDVYEKLMSTKEQNNGSMPHYFGFLTVMAFYVFVREKVDVALLEVGIGGEYDSTNVVRKPIVCGISSLDLDHTNLLGHTLEDIAWHKEGSRYHGSPARITIVGHLNRAKEIGSPLYVAPPLTQEELCAQSQGLGIAGDRQRYNAALAVQLCRVWLQNHSKSYEERLRALGDQAAVTSVSDIPHKPTTDLSPEMVTGLSQCRWPGRTQTIFRPGVTYYLDGAHTTDSMQQCVEWFQQVASKEQAQLGVDVCRALVFNMTGDRPVSFLLKLLQGCGFHMAAFCPNIVSTISSENIPDQMNLTVEQETVMKKSVRNRKAWDQLFALRTRHSSSPSSSPDRLNGRAPNSPSAVTSPNHLNGHAPTESPAPELILNGELGDHSSEKARKDGEACDPSTLPPYESAQFPCIASALRWATQNKDMSFLTAVSVTDEDLNLRTGREVPHIQVLVTGSLHLVGGVLELLIPDMNE
ncbi:hypothetical protein BaRGS_00020685 [Batillaria attramentaria]|uniref:tetrahydrofolate synthase n=1 Tax=Batillaria attramentaria TaxID=370345 RepID=A0ABD0KLS4_9CAEN